MEGLGKGKKNDAAHHELKEYETKRRLAYSSKLESISLYWKSYKDLLSASLQETKRAHRLVLGTCRAFKIYADAISDVHDDILFDEKGNIATEKQQKRLAGARKKTSMPPAELQDKAMMFSKVRTSHQDLAEKFAESGQNMDEEIAAAIGTLFDDVQEQFSKMDTLGGNVIEELERTEQEVTEAWGGYLSVAPSMVPGTTQEPSLDAQARKDNADRWLVEAQYRVAVSYQNQAWESASSELDNLFKRVKEEEITRRMNLREFLVAFVQRQQRLYSSLPGIQNTLLEHLVSAEASREELEQKVQNFINGRVKCVQETFDDEVDGIPISGDSSLNLQSPLTSDLLVKAKVLKRRNNTNVSVGSSTGWKLSLCAMTADAYLHFFDIEESSKISLDATPEDVLQVLMPSVVVPTHETVLAGRNNFSKGWSDILAPADSVVLAKCNIQKEDELSFWVIEKGGSTTASKMFGKLVDKKFLVKASTKADADDWISIITS